MKKKYNIEWLTEVVENGEKLKFLFFWGHAKNPNQRITQACFSQWYESPFKVNGVNYKTSEHWMMSQKALLFDNLDIHKQIIESNKPGSAKEFGRKVTGFDEKIWTAHRSKIVIMGNIHKFNQNRELGEYLINTQNRIIVEASPVDRIWGIGLTKESNDARNVYAWRGLNLLGFALMEARDFLKDYGFFETNFDFQPPWNKEPKIEHKDMFWRTGKGKEIIVNFSKKWQDLEERQKEIFKISFPEPKSWKGFYK